MNTNRVARKWTAEHSDIALSGAVKSPHPPFYKGGQRAARGDFRAQLCTKLVRFDFGFVTVLVMTCGLVLGGLASPAAAKTIVVTTLDDTADPPFDADGNCGTGTVDDLPGADGRISLREAIIAANNTNGKKTITFDPKSNHRRLAHSPCHPECNEGSLREMLRFAQHDSTELTSQ